MRLEEMKNRWVVLDMPPIKRTIWKKYKNSDGGKVHFPNKKDLSGISISLNGLVQNCRNIIDYYKILEFTRFDLFTSRGIRLLAN